jgi:polyhydroxybutyrate depolymerase
MLAVAQPLTRAKITPATIRFVERRTTWLLLAGCAALASCLLPVDEFLNPAPVPNDGSGGHQAPVGGTGGEGGQGGEPPVVACVAGTKDGPPEGASELTPLGSQYLVRPPPGYDPTVGHPLITVYSPAGITDPVQNEGITQLTPAAHARGYVIAYVENVSPADFDGVEDAGLVPGLIASRWCIDGSRTYMTGHSNGGTLTTLMGIYMYSDPLAAAIAPSAAGVSESMFFSSPNVVCPATLPAVMVLHSTNDTLFPVPDFGIAAATWWSNCASCTGPGRIAANGCTIYPGCAKEIQYCESAGPHGQWPGINEDMLDFFERFTLTTD